MHPRGDGHRKMIQYLSITGGSPPVDLESAIIQGFASDGGLFVPDRIPLVSPVMLDSWSDLSYTDLAFEIVSFFIDPTMISTHTLRDMLTDSFSPFTHPHVVPVVQPSADEQLWVMELFHGPTLSFKDVAMGFLVNLLNLLLKRKNQRLNLLVVTSGDTGPAAAHAAAGKSHLDCWVLFPTGMISEQQQRQMTTLEATNVHAIGVDRCRGGCDDLDRVVAGLFADADFRRQVELSSVNSINWGRVLMQIVHYFYAYFQVARKIGEPIAFAVPTGAVGNLFSGYLARQMGLPIDTLIAANNQNAAVHRLLTTGTMTRTDLVQSYSSAIDIVIPCNLWRYLYFAADRNHDRIYRWMTTFETSGQVVFDAQTLDNLRQGLVPAEVDDRQAIDTMAAMHRHSGYLLDPHGAVAVAAARQTRQQLSAQTKVVCLATAHPAKFPQVIRKALRPDGRLPAAATHTSIRQAATYLQRLRSGDLDDLAAGLRRSILAVSH